MKIIILISLHAGILTAAYIPYGEGKTIAVDWRCVCRMQGCSHLLINIHRLPTVQPDIKGILQALTYGVDVPALLVATNTHCTAASIALVPHSTQTIDTFLIWLVFQLVSNDCYRSIDENLILDGLRALMAYNPSVYYKESDTQKNVFDYCHCIASNRAFYKAIVAVLTKKIK